MRLLHRGVLAASTAAVIAGCGTTASTTAAARALRASTPAATAAATTVAPSPRATGLTLAQTDALVRTLYYDESQAFGNSLADGFAYSLAHDYPGAVNREKFQACAAAFEAQHSGILYTFVPEISTLAPDPTWTGPHMDLADWTFAGKRPLGQTYILTIDQTEDGTPLKDQEHITVLRGSAYFFVSACG